jgi:hypothetical protein
VTGAARLRRRSRSPAASTWALETGVRIHFLAIDCPSPPSHKYLLDGFETARRLNARTATVDKAAPNVDIAILTIRDDEFRVVLDVLSDHVGSGVHNPAEPAPL